MEAFIVRPFNVKQDIDFEKVHNELILPAIKLASQNAGIVIKAGTTAPILEQGNIREDMFTLLLTADLVIADISIHNANVFYELGIRHALQDKRTFLIRCAKDEVPFDLKTDRYLSYEAANPAAAIAQLAAGIRATILSEKQDSPVFYMLPTLEAQNRERFLAVPAGFIEEVERAVAIGASGKLALLALEANDFPWFRPALRVVGNAQFGLGVFEAARITWEMVREGDNQNDREANDRLATIYDRLAEGIMSRNMDAGKELLSQSNQAITRLLGNLSDFEKNKRAEAYALRARNSKTNWTLSWKDKDQGKRREIALRSAYLPAAIDDYLRGFMEDLNHAYSGLNALAMVATIICLAEGLPDTWIANHDTEEEAAQSLAKYKERKSQLQMAVAMAIEAEKAALQRASKKDPWLSVIEADYACVVSTKPARVAKLYRDAILGATGLNLEASRRQLLLFEMIGLAPENVQASLAEFAEIPAQVVHDRMRYILFTGHMIDQQDRPAPRFPAAIEPAVTAAIRKALEKETGTPGITLKAVAGGACGGDIIFHEQCVSLAIPSLFFLALPREKFLQESVSFAGLPWVDRFNTLYQTLPVSVLSETKQLPAWLQKKPDYNIWIRNNLWMLNKALECGGLQMTLIALWDGKGGDAPGGTAHMVATAKEKGARIVVINPGEF